MVETRRQSRRILTSGLNKVDETTSTTNNTRNRRITKNLNKKHEIVNKNEIAKKSKNETIKKYNNSCDKKKKPSKIMKKKLTFIDDDDDLEKPTNDENLVNDNDMTTEMPPSHCIVDRGPNGLFNFYNDEIVYVNKMIENLLKTSEASSLIVCGDAGVGKTKLIETCLSSFPILTIQQLCQENPALENNFIVNNSLIETELARSFAINPNFDEINRIAFEYSFLYEPDADDNCNQIDKENVKNKKPSTISDPKIIAISRLNKNDLIFLMILLHHLRNEDFKVFTCADLFNWSIGCSLLRKTRIGMIIKSINNLIGADMVILESDCY
ncbi:hypothetical protein BLA29_003391, partial [Euroglyphus maynei]